MKSNKLHQLSWIRTLAAVSAVVGVSGCTNNHAHLATGNAAVRPSANVQDSFGSANAQGLGPSISDIGPGQDQDSLVIKKSALGKEFLLFGNLIPQTQEPTSSGLKGRVVTFTLTHDNTVVMQETNDGHIVASSLPAHLLLAQFPIKQETSDSLVLDFNSGMNHVSMDGAMFASDATPTGKTYQDTVAAESIKNSYVESIQTVGNNVEIQQIAQVPEVVPAGSPNAGQTNYTGYEIRYYLAPYLPNSNYTPKESSDFTRVGFFEIEPQVDADTGRTTTRIATRDLSHPVVYAISSNTPAAYRNAVREGVLYWNQVFGREVVQVVDAPEGVTAPDPRYNIVQWVENDSAGFAYADALMDPHTGEILHSQVYMTSVFGTDGALRVPSLIREMPKTASNQNLLLSSWGSSRLCEHPVSAQFAQAIAQMRTAGTANPALYQKIGQDYVRTTVAHEIGHTLGMRHNFAGSLAATASPDQVDQMFNDYVLNGTVPTGQSFTSSIMEYNVFNEDILHSQMIKAKQLVFSYDKEAMDWAYNNKPIDESTAPLFCTDSQESKYLDCLTFDQGSEPIVSNMMAIRKSLRLLPASIVEKYILAKAPTDPRDQKSMNDVALDPDAILTKIMAPLQSQISWMKRDDGALSIRTHRLFPFDTSFYEDDMKAAQDSFVAQQIKDAGGIDSALLQFIEPVMDPSQSIAASASAGIDAYLSRDDVRNGIGWDGKTQYQLSDADIALISSRGKTLFGEIEEKAFEAAITQLGQGSYLNPQYAHEIESELAKTAEFVIMARTSQAVQGSLSGATPSPGPSASPSSAQAMAFRFNKAVRLSATKLLAHSLGATSDWSLTGRTQVASELKKYLTAVLGGQDPSSVDLSNATPELREWVLDQKSVLGAIENSAEM
ncbi:MAG: zinc-dependent metalloprotease [Oligoflexia bacterium]|nr:zinc-dependent metalloprotease [Oligoflexia bacterium]